MSLRFAALRCYIAWIRLLNSYLNRDQKPVRLDYACVALNRHRPEVRHDGGVSFRSASTGGGLVVDDIKHDKETETTHVI